MDELLAIDMFKHFSEDLDKKLKNKFIKCDRNGYYTIITQNKYYDRRPMAYKEHEAQKYSFRELYEEMCDLFYLFDEGYDYAIYKMILLKNFVNYKMQKEVA